jgi:hypothetical protein
MWSKNPLAPDEGVGASQSDAKPYRPDKLDNRVFKYLRMQFSAS